MNIGIMLLLISLLVLVHEAGHFMAARMCGVRVTRFGIGMPLGPSWKLFKWGYTTFYLHAFLFGGYVSFPDDSQEESEKNEDEILPSDSPELYENKTISQKLFIVSAGVIMNVIFAYFLVILCASIYHKLPTATQNIFVNGFANEKTSNIQSFDVQKGDKFYKANGVMIDNMYKLQFFAKNSRLFDDYAQNDLIEQNLKDLKKLNPNIADTIKAGQTIKLPAMKEEKPLEANEKMLKGLEKYKQDGTKLTETQIVLRNDLKDKKTYKFEKETSLQDVAYALSDTYKPLAMTFLRGENEMEFTNVKINEKGLLGILLKYEEIYEEINTVKDVFVKSYNYIHTTTMTMLQGLWSLFTGKVPFADMHGIIAVTKIGGDIIASKGIISGILLTAMISINLAIMNFLPIPALDGGHVMFLLIEKITGKKPSKEFSDAITNFCFFFLVFLMVAISYNDIFGLITKKF